MAPRRGGEAGAGAQVALGGGRGCFEPPPLRRTHPWQQDGSGQCDILAGGVESGAFKGVYVSGVHLVALLRTLQLSKAFMPVDTTTPVAALGQSLQDGIPIVVVTRGCFGRAKDYGAGPVRNEMQKSVWETCRQMRADMPQVLITCIDLPINCTADIVEGCLEPPLAEYRELMYHEGAWYTPSVVNAATLAKFRAEHKKERTLKTGTGVNFNRKKFAWIDENMFYKDMWTIGWKEVLQVKEPPTVPKRVDLNFVDRQQTPVRPIQDATPSAAQATLRKILAQAREAGDAKQMAAGIKAYLDRAKWSEKEGMEEAVNACMEAAQLFKGESNQLEACTTIGMAVGTYIYVNEVDKALQLATEFKSSATDPKVDVKAARLLMDCHFAIGETDKALDVARQASADAAKKGDAEASFEACGLVVTCLLSKGDTDEALATATEATKAMDKKGQAKSWLLVAEAQMAVASQVVEGDVASKRRCLEEAVNAQKTARALFQELGMRKEEGEALQGATGSLMEMEDFVQALALAKELQAFSGVADALALGAAGSQLVAMASLRQYLQSGSYPEGGEEAMLAAAKQAVAAFEQLNDTTRRGAAQQTLREAIRTATKNI